MSILKFTSILVLTLLISCSGGGGGGGDSVSGVSYQVGQFVDDPVAGLTYSCSSAGNTQTITGSTDTDGHFNYLSGQSCTFKVGNVTLGSLTSIPSDGKVTPQDVAGVSRSATAAPSALAIAQFLQSLNDGTSNGRIVIPVVTTAALSSNNVSPVNLISSSGSISQADLLTVLTAAGKTLVSASVAKAALDTQIASGNVTTSYGTVSASSPVVLNSIAVSSTTSPPVGLTDQLKATGYFSDGSTVDLTKSVTWTSSDTSKVTVDINGLASGLMKGSATVTASYIPSNGSNAISAKFNETVIDPTPLSIFISYVLSGITSIQNSATTLLKAIVSFSDTTTQIVSSGASWTVTSNNGGGNALVSVNASANTASLTGTSPGVISIIASYLGINSNSLGLTITTSALPPRVSNSSISLNVIGVADSTVTGTISASDPQGYSLSYSVSQDGAYGKATINPTSGAFTYLVSGHTNASNDSFVVQISNSRVASYSTVSVNLNSDPLIQSLWHIKNLGSTSFASVLPTSGNDMNIAGAWAAGYSGRGVKVAIVDTGLEVAHEDLIANIDIINSRNLITGTTNTTPSVSGEDHGTQVAGIVAASAYNGKGVRGVAFNSTLRGYNLLASGAGTLTNFGNALGLASYSADIDIFNESFASSQTSLPPLSQSFNAINNNAMTMRGGKGAIFVQSAGNEFQSLGSYSTVCSSARLYGVSCGDPATDTRRGGYLSIVVGAINSDGVKSSYSNTGSSIWISAPGGEYGFDSSYIPSNGGFFSAIASWVRSFIYKPAIVTTALTGCTNAANGTNRINSLDAQGQNSNAVNCQYTALMNGTSAAAPNVSGVIALMLEANPNLGFRDVKYILAKTAKKTDASNSGVTTPSVINGGGTPVTLDQGWFKNSANYWFSNSYGFGSIDASAAVSMAQSYTNYLPTIQTASLSKYYTNTVNVSNSNVVGSTMTFAMTPSFAAVEHVLLYVNMSASPSLTCNQIELTSPAGTKSILMHAANGFSTNGVAQTSIPGSRFLSNAFYGEPSSGTWTVRFLDFCASANRTTFLSSDIQTLTILGH